MCPRNWSYSIVAVGAHSVKFRPYRLSWMVALYGVLDVHTYSVYSFTETGKQYSVSVLVIRLFLGDYFIQHLTLAIHHVTSQSQIETFALPYPCFGPFLRSTPKSKDARRQLFRFAQSFSPQLSRLIKLNGSPNPSLLFPPLRRHMTEKLPRLCHPRHHGTQWGYRCR